MGDLAETIALLLPETEMVQAAEPLHYYIEKLAAIEKQSEAVKKQFIVSSWKPMSRGECFVFNKLITGAFRIGV